MFTIVRGLILTGLGCCLLGCETNAQTGALAGGLGGAGVGAIIGSYTGSAGKGALIGGAVGTVGGYMVGNEMDKTEQRNHDRAVQNATRPPQYADPPRNNQVTKADVINWTKDGVKDEVIIDRIQRSGSTYHVTPADENELRDAGVSEEVVRTMKYSER